MTLAEALDTTRIHRVARLTGRRTAFVTTRLFRAPHHTISDVGLIGGGQVPMPGEVSLAHHGVLFLDELPEFRRHVLEVLRQPLGDGVLVEPPHGRPGSHGAGGIGHHAPAECCGLACAMTGSHTYRDGRGTAAVVRHAPVARRP
jgi:hypothetical protein